MAVTFETRAVERLGAFWASLLERQVVHEGREAALPPQGTQVGLRFVPAPDGEPGRSWLHLHLTSASAADQLATVEKALDLGARHLDVGQLPDEGHVVLGDPDGNAFCVIEPGNRFLAGCGDLGEVTCEGSRDVGLFWRDALGWPLVWDRDEETAIQLPAGGTKLSWGGPPVSPKETRNRQRFELAAADAEGEVARLVALGAIRLGVRDGATELADPDGNEFWLLPLPRPR